MAQQRRLDGALVDAWDAVLGEDYDAAIRRYSEALLMIADQRTLVKLSRDTQAERNEQLDPRNDPDERDLPGPEVRADLMGGKVW